MGGEPWLYFVDYEPDVTAVLHKLRQREFQAGRYNPVIDSLDIPIGLHSPSPGAQHATIEEAMEEADADGTRSILDMQFVADEPDYFTVCPLGEGVLEDLYGTTKPTRQMVEDNMDFFEDIERGQGIYFFTYEHDKPVEIVFAGYSFD